MRASKVWFIGAALSFGLLLNPAHAQEKNTPAVEAPKAADSHPLEGLDAKQMAEFFMLVASISDLDAELTPLIDQMFEPGEVEPD